MSKEHRMPSRSSRTLVRKLSSAGSGVVSRGGSAKREVARTSGQRPPKSGDSQSLETEGRIAQMDGLGIDSVRRSVDALSLEQLASRVVRDVYKSIPRDIGHANCVDCVAFSFRDDQDDFSRGFGPISVLRAMEVHGFRCSVRSPFICRTSFTKRSSLEWFVGFTGSGATGWNGLDDYVSSGPCLAIAVARAAVFALSCIAERKKRGGR